MAGAHAVFAALGDDDCWLHGDVTEGTLGGQGQGTTNFFLSSWRIIAALVGPR